MKTMIAYGSPNKDNTSESHGSPLGDEIMLTKQNLGWPWKSPSTCPTKPSSTAARLSLRRAEEQNKWKDLSWHAIRRVPGGGCRVQDIPVGRPARRLGRRPPYLRPRKGPMATRTSSGQVIQAIATKALNLMSGAADLYPSTDAYIKRVATQGRQLPGPQRPLRHPRARHGRYPHRALSSTRADTFGSTFLIFYDYMRPPLRLAAL